MPERPALAVIGIGRLGIRHLESLYKSDRPATLFAVDPRPNSLDAAASHLGTIPAGTSSHAVGYLTSVEDLPTAVDVAVVSTTADVRLEVLQRLLTHASVKYLILEKVLFQRPGDYQRAGELIRSAGATAYVNCPRRMYDAYRRIKRLFDGRQVTLIAVTGGEWGIACNGVHFADLCQYLTGRSVVSYSLQLDHDLLPSKRDGFVEFTGTVLGHAGPTKLMMTASARGIPKLRITIAAEDLTCAVDEELGQAEISENGRFISRFDVDVPRQSSLTSLVVDDLLGRGSCDLPTYAESAAAHVPLLDAFISFIQSTNGVPVDLAPIT